MHVVSIYMCYVCMYVSTYICMYLCMHVRTYLYVCFMYVCMYIRMYVFMFARTYVFICMYLCTCVYVRRHVCTYIHMFVCVCMCICVCVCVCVFWYSNKESELQPKRELENQNVAKLQNGAHYKFGAINFQEKPCLKLAYYTSSPLVQCFVSVHISGEISFLQEISCFVQPSASYAIYKRIHFILLVHLPVEPC